MLQVEEKFHAPNFLVKYFLESFQIREIKIHGVLVPHCSPVKRTLAVKGWLEGGGWLRECYW